MVNGEWKVKRTLHLELTEEHVVYLHELTQNAYMYTEEDSEPEEQSILRAALFDATDLTEVSHG